MIKNKKVLVVIPARLGGYRFPDKPIRKICGKPMIEWVWKNTVNSKYVDKTIIATPDEKIIEISSSFGADSMITKNNHSRGTERVYEVYEKLDRNFDILINILGADHSGYIKRIVAAVEALSGKKDKLICKVSQLVKLIKEGKPFKMSKRKGDYITIEDLMNEVGKDATRFIMLNRSSDVELEFNFNKVKEKSKDNPLYYVQYCYARISSVFRHLNLDINDNLDIQKYDFNYKSEEIEILKKVSQWPKCIDLTTKNLEPHRIPVYLYELSSLFHSYWNLGKDNKSFRFINENKQIDNSRLVFLKVISIVIKSGMKIVGVDTPEKM